MHTKSDKEFKYVGDVNYFVSNYIDKLEEEEIKLAAITNHNKFNLDEYEQLRKAANKKDIMILPGVELSVKEGRGGIHCLIIFDRKEWIRGEKDKINSFLDQVFAGDFDRENANATCNFGLIQVMEILNSYSTNYFIILAHVDDNKGLFKELNWQRIKELSTQDIFKEKVIGFQKANSFDNLREFKKNADYDLAVVQGSDCKSIKQIGKGKKSYIKIGNDNLESIILALNDFESRTSEVLPEVSNGFIESVRYEGGKLDGVVLNLSSELNSLIGIRGSGKSSIIETIRYALNIEPASDEEYKNEIVKYILSSGGKITLKVRDRFDEIYYISRLLNERPHIYDENGTDVNIKVNTIINNPMYFGQKDLSSTDDNYEMNLLEKMVNIDTKRNETELYRKNKSITAAIDEIIELNELEENTAENSDELEDINHKISLFDEHGVSKKLQEQINYETDLNNIKQIKTNLNTFINKINTIIESTLFKELTDDIYFERKTDTEILNSLEDNLTDIKSDVFLLTNYKQTLKEKVDEIDSIHDTLDQEYESKKESFAKIKREIDIPNINPDHYPSLKKQQNELKKNIKANENNARKTDTAISKLKTFLREKNEFLRKVFSTYNDEIQAINNSQNALKLEIIFKGDKKTFAKKLKAEFKGSNITSDNYQKIATEYTDFSDLIIDLLTNAEPRLNNILTSEKQRVFILDRIIENYEELISIETANKINILYHGTPLRKHSVGQRSSAILLLILMQKENDLIIIDQPEDDLDNKVIYEEIITEIKSNKIDIQFIFATHNANIPVLGDSEQIIAVENIDEEINTIIGSIDNIEIQSQVITIMEGGPQAFNIRKEIYNLWNSQSVIT